jgi:hypothetical protein
MPHINQDSHTACALEGVFGIVAQNGASLINSETGGFHLPFLFHEVKIK